MFFQLGNGLSIGVVIRRVGGGGARFGRRRHGGLGSTGGGGGWCRFERCPRRGLGGGSEPFRLHAHFNATARFDGIVVGFARVVGVEKFLEPLKERAR